MKMTISKVSDIAFSLIELAYWGVAVGLGQLQAPESVGKGPQSVIYSNRIHSTGREHPLGEQTLLTDTVVCEPQGWTVKWRWR